MDTNQKILISGSWAYDYLMAFDGLFKEAILPEKIDHLSVGFTAASKTIHFGGCAGNIAYTLKLFGVDPIVVGLVGDDFDNYHHWMEKHGINVATLTHVPNQFTASAYILTDREQNQIQIFHGGAMLAAPHLVSLRDFHYQPIGMVMISPDDPKRMIRLAQECKELKLPYYFDPSQQITNIDPEILRMAIEGATGLILNEYETDLLATKLRIKPEDVSKLVPTFIQTMGEKGISISTQEGGSFVRSIKPSKMVNPTGCGDAFRSGLLFGLFQNLSLEKSAQIGALAATYVIEHEGTQEHTFTLDEFKKRMEDSFGEAF